MARASNRPSTRPATAWGGLSAALLLPGLAQAGTAAPTATAAPGAALLWLAAVVAVCTTLAWVLQRPPARARWPSIGFGVALLAVMLGIMLQLVADLGSGHSALQIRFGRRTAEAASRPAMFGAMIAAYLAALAASGWGAWRLLRRH